MNYKDYIRIIPDFPKKGIIFKDITPMIKDGAVFKKAVKEMAAQFADQSIDLIAGPEARGFLIGMPLAYEFSLGFVPVRKKGKLPAETIQEKYQLEYGDDILEMHRDAVSPGQRVLIVDDLLATGGTALTTARLVEKLGGIVAGFSFMVELSDLNGREVLKDYKVFSLIKY